MVHQAARFAGFALGIALLAAVVVGGSTFAQEAQGIRLMTSFLVGTGMLEGTGGTLVDGTLPYVAWRQSMAPLIDPRRVVEAHHQLHQLLDEILPSSLRVPNGYVPAVLTVMSPRQMTV